MPTHHRPLCPGLAKIAEQTLDAKRMVRTQTTPWLSFPLPHHHETCASPASRCVCVCVRASCSAFGMTAGRDRRGEDETHAFMHPVAGFVELHLVSLAWQRCPSFPMLLLKHSMASDGKQMFGQRAPPRHTDAQGTSIFPSSLFFFSLREDDGDENGRLMLGRPPLSISDRLSDR